MKPKKLKTGDKVKLPSGEIGEVISELPVGEYQIYVAGVGFVFYYPEDLTLQPNPEAGQQKN